MLDVKKIQDLILMRSESKPQSVPKHVILNTWTKVIEAEEDKKKQIEEKKLSLLKEIVGYQLEYGIPIFTINIGEQGALGERSMISLFDFLKEHANRNKVRVLVIGKWTGFPGHIVDAMKSLVLDTKEYDSYFLNVCVNYDGKTEIFDAARVVLKKLNSSRLGADALDLDTIKENLYSSYFLPPDLVIEMGTTFSGTFLWDSKGSRIIFIGKQFQDFVKQDFVKGLEHYSR